MALRIHVFSVAVSSSWMGLIADMAMGRRRRSGVGVAEMVVSSNSATTPTATRGEPIAGNVGVLELFLATGSAATSTLPAAAAKEGGKAGGVDVAAMLLPTRSATTPTPTEPFLATKATTSVADLNLVTIFATTLVTDLTTDGGRTGGRG